VAEDHAIVTFMSAFAQLGDSKDLTLTEISRLTSVGDSARFVLSSAVGLTELRQCLK
jgi:hypothetical protein